MLTATHLIPAYGRYAPTEAALLEDYRAGRDFKILRGPYCSCRDFDALDTLVFHYLRHLGDEPQVLTIDHSRAMRTN